MSDNVPIGNASQLADDDIARDVNMQRSASTIHKVPPNLLRSSNLLYSGHTSWIIEPLIVEKYITISADDAAASFQNQYTTGTIDLTDYAPKDNIIKGVVVGLVASISINNAKTKLGSQFNVRILYSAKYNTQAFILNSICGLHFQTQTTDAENRGIQHKVYTQAFMPVIYFDGIPYITWSLFISFTGMSTNSGSYQGQGVLSLQGFIF